MRDMRRKMGLGRPLPRFSVYTDPPERSQAALIWSAAASGHAHQGRNRVRTLGEVWKNCQPFLPGDAEPTISIIGARCARPAEQAGRARRTVMRLGMHPASMPFVPLKRLGEDQSMRLVLAGSWSCLWRGASRSNQLLELHRYRLCGYPHRSMGTTGHTGGESVDGRRDRQDMMARCCSPCPMSLVSPSRTRCFQRRLVLPVGSHPDRPRQYGRAAAPKQSGRDGGSIAFRWLPWLLRATTPDFKPRQAGLALGPGPRIKLVT